MAKKRLKRKSTSDAFSGALPSSGGGAGGGGARGASGDAFSFSEWIQTPVGIGGTIAVVLLVAALIYFMVNGNTAAVAAANATATSVSAAATSSSMAATAAAASVPPTSAPAGTPRTGRVGDFPPSERNNFFTTPPTMTIDLTKQYVATIKTPVGDIVVNLDAVKAPQTVNNFVYLAQAGFYDGLVFHRVETDPSFNLIQGGDPMGSGMGGPGYTVPAEIGLPHTAGAIAMARTGDEINPTRASSGSQFYIGISPLTMLDGQYTVFGYATAETLPIVQKVTVGELIQSVTITTK